VPNALAGVPGTLRGTLTGVDPRALDLKVSTPDGRIDIGGTVFVRASYQRLDQNNIATAQTATSTTVRAYCFVGTPDSIDWTAS
jgi:hypothetical protein